ncbi:MAG TPA: Uma2 family endonuclease [Blastocatellia bacterium]|nr:Uma2 family endonuclease [Blastocatellia bacterium]
MASKRSEPLYSVEEYLAMERASYIDGYIFAMAGESGAHADISTNLVREVSTQLRGTPCRVRTKDTKVHSGPTPIHRRTTKFSYSDLVVICREPQYHYEHQDVVINPTVIIEVLSESTESFDRGVKLLRYRTHNPTLTDYLLVSQSSPWIDHFHKDANGEWRYSSSLGLDNSLNIASIDCTLRLAEVYDRVVFPPEEDEEQNEE